MKASSAGADNLQHEFRPFLAHLCQSVCELLASRRTTGSLSGHFGDISSHLGEAYCILMHALVQYWRRLGEVLAHSTMKTKGMQDSSMSGERGLYKQNHMNVVIDPLGLMQLPSNQQGINYASSYL